MPRFPLSVLRATFTFILVILVAAAAAAAQTPNACGVGPAGETMVQGLQGASKSASPLSVTISITHEQKFADGNAIHGATTTHQYRDSTGRTRLETPMGCSLTAEGEMKPSMDFEVIDPVAHSALSWEVNRVGTGNIARFSHMTVHPAAVDPTQTTEQRQQVRMYSQQRASRIVRESMGSRSIAGISCDDVRTTLTTPAGEQGNDLPLQQITETCTSRDLGLILRYAQESPQSGRTVLEITDVTMGEPDASLFKPPAGFTVQEQKTVAQVAEQK